MKMSPRSFSTGRLRAALRDVGGPARPDYLPDLVAQASRIRQRPAWTFHETWLPTDVGAQRRGLPPATLVASVLLLVVALAAGAVVVGSRVTQREPLGLPTTPNAWERVAIYTPSVAGRVATLAVSARGLLAVVSVQDGPAELVASPDGRAWTRVPPESHPAIGRDGAGWALVGSDRGFLLSNGDVWSSADGFDWQLLTRRGEDTDLGHGEMLGVAAGGPGYIGIGSGNSAWYSTDGSDWSLARVPPPPTAFFESQGFATPAVDMRGIAVAGDRLVATGIASRHTEASGLTAPVMWASQDGRTWTSVPDPPAGDPAAVAAGPGGFVAIGKDWDSGAANVPVIVSTSADGVTWKQVDTLGPGRSTNADGKPVDLDVASIAASDSGFVAAGWQGEACLFSPCEPGNAVIWTSADGRTWSQLAGDERFVDAGASDIVAWGSRFVIGGESGGKPVLWISDAE